jgi:hypothetical protein
VAKLYQCPEENVEISGQRDEALIRICESRKNIVFLITVIECLERVIFFALGIVVHTDWYA